MNLKGKIASGLGSSLEWYDFALYGYFASIFANHFFPSHAHHYEPLIESFSVFAIGFAARPIGGILFGYLGDKSGRIKCLKLTPIIITFASVSIAFIPTYNQIGIFAPILLLVLRIIQGICIGGEFAGNIVYLCEANIKQRYFAGSIASCTGGFGVLLASFIASLTYILFTNQQVCDFGWRLAFLFSLVPGIIAFYIRKNMPETPIFEELKKYNFVSNKPLLDAIKIDRYKCLLAIGILLVHANTFYFVFMFLPSFLTTTLGLKTEAALIHNNLLLLTHLLIVPFMGILAGKISGKHMMQLSSAAFLILGYGLFSLILSGKHFYIYFAIGVLVFLTTLNAGAVPGLLIELLPAPTRYTTLAFAFNVSFGIFGGSVSMVSYLLIKESGNIITPIFYLIASAAISLIAASKIKKPPYKEVRHYG